LFVADVQDCLSLLLVLFCLLLFGTELANNLQVVLAPPLDISLAAGDKIKLVRDLDNVLNICYKQGLYNAEQLILENYSKAPASSLILPANSYALMTNFKSTTKKLGKFAPMYVGPVKIIEQSYGDFYIIKDLVQDTQTVAHIMNLVPFECASDDEAREIAASDYNEFFVARVTGHKQFGTENLTSKLYFTVEFDDGDIDSFAPLHDLLFVEEAKNYVLKHQPELAAALLKLCKLRNPIIQRSVSRKHLLDSMSENHVSHDQFVHNAYIPFVHTPEQVFKAVSA
jgi:hypothetical protein